MADSYTEDTLQHKEASSLLGIVAIRWNMSENILKEILEELFDGNVQIQVLIAHMGNTTLRDAVRTISPYRTFENIDDAIQHYITFMDIMREHRNYIIHGCQMFGQHEGELGFIIRQISARKDPVQHAEVITAPVLKNIVREFDALISYGSRLLQHISPSMQAYLGQLGESGPFPLPNKPVLPKRLQKPRSNLPGMQLHPEPSGE